MTDREGGAVWSGCGTALVTPFRADLSLDEAAMRRLVRRQVDAGINFLVPCGTTGENPTLSREETLRVVEITVEEAQGRVPVLAGCGGYNTAEIVSLAKELESLHVDGILSVTPYYNKPTQEGLYRHFKAIAEAIAIPDGALQCAAPDGRQHRARHAEAACGNRKHRRREGSVGRHQPDCHDSRPGCGGISRCSPETTRWPCRRLRSAGAA